MFVTITVRAARTTVKRYPPLMTSEWTEPRSRRARPAKAPLSRDLIVETALRILDRDGIDALTMRRVAQELDTGPASLYVYIENRDQLLKLVLDRVIGEVELPGPDAGDWRARLQALVASSVAVLARRRGLALVALATIPTGPNALAITEAMLNLLREGGVDAASSAWGVDLLASYVSATAAEQSMYNDMMAEGQTEAGLLSQVDSAFRALPLDRYPAVVAMRGLLLSGSGEERQQWGIDVILNGLLATPPPLVNDAT
jgi:AcrR family transcriptional regulator